jgi:hypothetical protein
MNHKKFNTVFKKLYAYVVRTQFTVYSLKRFMHGDVTSIDNKVPYVISEKKDIYKLEE